MIEKPNIFNPAKHVVDTSRLYEGEVEVNVAVAFLPLVFILPQSVHITLYLPVVV